jgi:hypothetical protein
MRPTTPIRETTRRCVTLVAVVVVAAVVEVVVAEEVANRVLAMD